MKKSKNKEILLKNNGIRIHPKVKTVGMLYVIDYSQLINAEGQRQLTARGILSLSDSISALGICTMPVVIKYNDKYVVVDGWHRVTVAKKHNSDILCTLVEPDCTIQELMVTLNTTMINWKPKDFLNFGIVYYKNKDYIALNEIWEETGISLIALYEVYSATGTGKERKRQFEQGIWRMTTKELGNRTIKYALALKKHIPFSTNANFLRGFATCVNKQGFNFQTLLEQVERYPSQVHPGDMPSQHAEMINKVYNHRALEEDQVYLA